MDPGLFVEHLSSNPCRRAPFVESGFVEISFVERTFRRQKIILCCFVGEITLYTGFNQNIYIYFV